MALSSWDAGTLENGVGERDWRAVWRAAIVCTRELQRWRSGVPGDQTEEITRLGMLSELDTIVALFL